MTTYILLFGIATIALVKFSNLFEKCLEKCLEKYHKFRKLNELVSTQYKGLEIYWVSSKIVAKSMYLDLCQYLNTSVKKIGKNKFEITYILNEQEYKFIINGKKGPKSIINIKDENDNDVTLQIEPYLGPQEDFHGNVFTPISLGYEKLTFELVGGKQLSFDKYTVMTIENIPRLITYD